MIQVVATSSQLCLFRCLLTRPLEILSLFLEIVLVIMLRRAVSNIKSEYLAAYLLDRLWLQSGNGTVEVIKRLLAHNLLLAFTIHSIC